MTDRQKILSEAERCSKCGKCRYYCPVFREIKTESAVARGRNHLTAEILKYGAGKFSNRTKELFSMCISCGACLENCPNKIDSPLLTLYTKPEIIKALGMDWKESFIYKFIIKNNWPLEKGAAAAGLSEKIFDKLHLHKVYRKVLAIAGISSAREMFPFKKKTFSSGFPEKIKGTPGMPHAVYFPGCSVNLAFENIGSSVIKILRQNGFTITVPDTVCCGMPPYNGGDPETAMVLGEKNLKILTDTNADIIVTSCSSGGSMLKHVYPEILGKKSLAVSEKVMDINDLMISLKNLKKPEIPVRKKITYHDPCHLNRRMHVNRQPRDIIKMIPGAEFIEMDTADTCCGGGGSFTLKHYELSLKILKKKIESFNRTGAEIIATACPACILQLKEGIRRFGRNKNALVLHTAELLASSYSDE